MEELLLEGLDNASMLADIYCFEEVSQHIYENSVRAEYMYNLTGNQEFVTEGFTDALKTMGHAIKTLIARIKDFFVSFLRSIKSYSMSLERFAKEYKDDLLKADCDFKIMGYNFNVMSSKDINMSDFNKLVATYNTVINDIKKSSLNDIVKEGNEFLSDTNLNEIRARVIGMNGAISKDDYIDEVKKFYRGSKDPVSIQVTSSTVKSILDDVDMLIKMRNAAVKDRDTIIALLSKAEMFFDRKTDIIYKDSERLIGTRTIDVSSDNVMSTKDAPIDHDDDIMKKVSQLLTIKYNETRALSSIINVAVTERANALKDMVVQNRRILGKAIRSPKDTNDNVSECSIDYTDLMEQVDYVLHDSYIEECNKAIAEEANWAITCMENGMISDAVMEAVGDKMIETFKTLVGKIIGMFQKKAIDMFQKYEPWFNDQAVIDAVTANAANKSLEVAEYWKVTPSAAEIQRISRLMKTVVAKPTDTSTCPWASPYVGATKISDLAADKDLDNKLKNFFRTGEKDSVKISKVTIGGNNLKSKIPAMFKYLSTYDRLAKSTQTLAATAKSLTVPVAENLNVNSHLGLLGRTVMESDMFLLEADDNPLAADKPTTAAAKIRSDGVAAEKKAGESPTKVVNKSNDDVKTQGQTETKTGDNTLADYYKTSVRFAQKVVSSYITVLEERYIVYVGIISNCTDKEHSPKFKDGKYIGYAAMNNNKAKAATDDATTIKQKK